MRYSPERTRLEIHERFMRTEILINNLLAALVLGWLAFGVWSIFHEGVWPGLLTLIGAAAWAFTVTGIEANDMNRTLDDVEQLMMELNPEDAELIERVLDGMARQARVMVHPGVKRRVAQLREQARRFRTAALLARPGVSYQQ